MGALGIILIIVLVIYFLLGIRIVRPIGRLIVETLGKYQRTNTAGFTWIFPIIQRTIRVNITEQMSDVEPQQVITKDNLNAIVDAVVYFKVNDVKSATYNVDDHEDQLVSLTRTTLRAVIGGMTFAIANEKRKDINTAVEAILKVETKTYGVDVLRVELQRIEAPKDVQDAMNEVVKAEREKIAAKDKANAVEIQADGNKRAAIKEAEGSQEAAILEAQGQKQARVLIAEGKAKAFDLIEKSFKGNAQILKQYEVTQASLQDNTKVVITEKGISPQLIMDAIPITNKSKK